MKIAVIGTGYVGLVSGTCFAEFGFNVTCVDIDSTKIANLKQGYAPIYEAELETLMKRNIEAGRLHFTTELSEALEEVDVISIAVGTPTRPEDGHADLSQVFNVVKDIAKTLKKEAIIITKSTVPVGTGKAIKAILAKENPSLSCEVASNPEFLREGNAVSDFMAPDRVVIGVEDPKAEQILSELYRPLSNQGIPVLFTDIASAELIKYASNTFLATKITFINEIADLCERLEADVADVAKGMGMDHRIGEKFLQAGPGFGGFCFPKDSLAMTKIGEDAKARINIVETVVKVNEDRKYQMVNKVLLAMGGEVANKRIALLGLTFKAETDDVRESSALVIADQLEARGANIIAYDPKGMDKARDILGERVTYASSTKEALSQANAVVIATEWQEFRSLTPLQLKEILKEPIVVDLRNLYHPGDMKLAGFRYVSIGRPPVGIPEEEMERFTKDAA